MNEEDKYKLANICAKLFLDKMEEEKFINKVNGAFIENEKLHSIIKEVRETVKWAYKEDEYQGGIYTIEQILDKES